MTLGETPSVQKVKVIESKVKVISAIYSNAYKSEQLPLNCVAFAFQFNVKNIDTNQFCYVMICKLN